MAWIIDTDAQRLVNTDGRTSFSRDEWSRQQFPGCPTCGSPIVVDGIPTPDAGGGDDVIPGRWRMSCRHNPFATA